LECRLYEFRIVSGSMRKRMILSPGKPSVDHSDADGGIPFP
jgi:hypothetical protein